MYLFSQTTDYINTLFDVVVYVQRKTAFHLECKIYQIIQIHKNAIDISFNDLFEWNIPTYVHCRKTSISLKIKKLINSSSQM